MNRPARLQRADSHAHVMGSVVTSHGRPVVPQATVPGHPAIYVPPPPLAQAKPHGRHEGKPHPGHHGHHGHPAHKGHPIKHVRPVPAAPRAARPDGDMLLLPGELWFGAGTPKGPRLRTLLGSCVAVTLWHPTRKLGGMCHYMLPERKRDADEPRDGRYGVEALSMLADAISRAGASPKEFVAHLYGGADTMPDEAASKLNIGERNIELGWTLIDHYGFELVGVDVGENMPRTVTLDLATGEVTMRRGGNNRA
jgi:chemotaxis protein CheD